MNSLQESTWLAGLLEGEGSFGIEKTKPPRRHILRVKIEMTDYDVLERVMEMAPGGRIYKRKKRKDRHKQSWEVKWTGVNAENLMCRIRSYMGLRRSAKIAQCLVASNLSHHCRELPSDV